MNRMARKVNRTLFRLYSSLNRHAGIAIILAIVISTTSGPGAWLIAAILLAMSLVIGVHALALNRSASRRG